MIPMKHLYYSLMAISIVFTFLVRCIVILNSKQVNHFENSIPTTSSMPEIDFPPHISSIFINLGSNLDPILPPHNYSSNSLTLAFEPIVACDMKAHPLLLVVPAAVSPYSGLTSMYLYNKNGRSSSLSRPSKRSFWNTGRQQDGTLVVVPTVTLRQILQAIPKRIRRIPYLKTDLQGYDWSVISSAGDDLRNRPVDYLYTEVYFDLVSTYKDVQNDFCRDWLPSMKDLGYDLVYVEKPDKTTLTLQSAVKMCSSSVPQAASTVDDLREGNALWKRHGAIDEQFDFN
jgi:FkbM family methyltransferase